MVLGTHKPSFWWFESLVLTFSSIFAEENMSVKFFFHIVKTVQRRNSDRNSEYYGTGTVKWGVQCVIFLAIEFAVFWLKLPVQTPQKIEFYLNKKKKLKYRVFMFLYCSKKFTSSLIDFFCPDDTTLPKSRKMPILNLFLDLHMGALMFYPCLFYPSDNV